MVKLTFEKRRAQLRQDTVPCTIIIDGDGDWKRFFTEEVPLTSPQWIEWCGGTPVSLLHYLRVESWAHDVSLERAVLSSLLGRDFKLQELEVQFDGNGKEKWGKCSWYKEHPKYSEPTKSLFVEPDKWRNIEHSMWKTEGCGDQKFSMLSLQMISAMMLGMPVRVLLNKAMVFHKAILTAPVKEGS